MKIAPAAPMETTTFCAPKPINSRAPRQISSREVNFWPNVSSSSCTFGLTYTGFAFKPSSRNFPLVSRNSSQPRVLIV